MSIGSEIRGQDGHLAPSEQRGPLLSCESLPYILSTVDAAIILLSCLLGGIGYEWSTGNLTRNLTPLCAVGLLASFIYIWKISGSGYYDFQNAAKARVEIVDITVSWIITGLLLAFFAFLLKVGVEFSRGAFVIFFLLAPVGLLNFRKISKHVLRKAIEQNLIGRRDIVLIGDHDELCLLDPYDL